MSFKASSQFSKAVQEDDLHLMLKVLEQETRFWEVYYHIGLHYERKGDQKKAMQYLQQALPRARNEGQTRKIQDALDGLRIKGPVHV